MNNKNEDSKEDQSQTTGSENRSKRRRTRRSQFEDPILGSVGFNLQDLLPDASMQDAFLSTQQEIASSTLDFASQVLLSPDVVGTVVEQNLEFLSQIAANFQGDLLSRAQFDLAAIVDSTSVITEFASQLSAQGLFLDAASELRNQLNTTEAINAAFRVGEVAESAVARLAEIQSVNALENWHRDVSGRKGTLTSEIREIKEIPAEDRPRVGRYSNEVRDAVQEIYDAVYGRLKGQELERFLEEDGVDVTLPGRPPVLGASHPVTQMIDELSEIFALLGFQTVFGPEVETAYYNFDVLNIPKDHPARDVWDTFYVDLPGEIVLRTHTSPMQGRVMEQQEPPVRVVVPGRVYRYEAQDASHEWMLHQLEGLAVDRNITMADLKGTLAEMARQLFGPERRTRFRCDFFPFVEPGVDFAVDCAICAGKGCRVCKGTGWLEMGGAGMVHPNVLRAVGYDPEVYTGFAFGLGIERLAMMRSGVDDIRAFAANDLRFLRQFARAA